MNEIHSVSRRGLLRSATTSGLVSSICLGAAGQERRTIEAKPEDVGTIEAILAAIYDVISGPKGQSRNWDRMRSLFVPEARLIPCRPKGPEGKVAIRTLTVEDYIARFGPTLQEQGFIERQVARQIDRFAHLAQVFSTYETRLDGEAKIIGRGVNGIQLLWDETRWWVVTIMWDAETPDYAIPPEYDAKK